MYLHTWTNSAGVLFVYNFRTNIHLNMQGSHDWDVTIMLLEGNKIKDLTEVTFL